MMFLTSSFIKDRGMLKPPKVKNIHQTLKTPKKETSLGEFTNY